MLDAVKIRFAVEKLISPGENWIEKPVKTRFGERSMYKYACGTVRMRLHCLPSNESFLWIEASLGQIVNGHNISSLSYADCVSAFEKLEAHVSENSPNIRVPPFREWLLSSIEFVHDWVVDDVDVIVADTALAITRDRRRKFTSYQNSPNSRAWMLDSENGVKHKLYNKEAEVKHRIKYRQDEETCKPFGHVVSAEQRTMLAAGKLRFEYTAGTKPLKAMIAPSSPTVGGLLMYLPQYGNIAIRDQWSKIMANWRPTDHSQVRNKLVEKYGLSRSTALLDFWVHVNMHGQYDYLICTGIPIGTFKNKRTLLKKAGVAFGSLLQPVLTIPPYIPDDLEAGFAVGENSNGAN